MIQEETIKKVFRSRLLSITNPMRIEYIELSENVGCSPNAARNWLLGNTLPYGHYLLDLCSSLDTTIGYLFGTNDFPVKYGSPQNSLKEVGDIFNRNILKLIEFKGITKDILAEEMLFIDVNGLNEMIRSKRMPKTARMIEICEALNVDLNYMCGYSSKQNYFRFSEMWEAQYGKEE